MIGDISVNGSSGGKICQKTDKNNKKMCLRVKTMVKVFLNSKDSN